MATCSSEQTGLRCLSTATLSRLATVRLSSPAMLVLLCSQHRNFRGARSADSFEPLIMTGSASLSSCSIFFSWGRHPFLGGDSDPGHMPPDKAIAEYRFAYGPNGALEGMERPPNTVPLEAMGEVVARHFIQAFGPASSRGIRPDAKTWVRVLEKLRSGLRMCLRANWHHYPGWLAACPWCTVESRTGVRLFGQRIGVVAATGTMARDTPPGAVSAIPEPDSVSAPPPERSRHSPPGVKVPSANSKIFREILIIICGIGSLGLVANGIPAGDIEIRRCSLDFLWFCVCCMGFSTLICQGALPGKQAASQSHDAMHSARHAGSTRLDAPDL